MAASAACDRELTGARRQRRAGGVDVRLRAGVVVLVAAVAALTWAPAQAQPAGPAGVRGVAGGMATRSVAEYQRLERTLQEHLNAHQADAARAMLDPGFELRSASGPDPLDAASWLRAESAPGAPPRYVRDLAVREFDDIAVVSFLLDTAAVGSPTRHGPVRFVVDVWRRSTSRLLSRFDDTPAHPPPPRLRPSGRG